MVWVLLSGMRYPPNPTGILRPSRDNRPARDTRAPRGERWCVGSRPRLFQRLLRPSSHHTWQCQTLSALQLNLDLAAPSVAWKNNAPAARAIINVGFAWLGFRRPALQHRFVQVTDRSGAG
jgi:hypothetical protein